ncbi:hypothetical protein BDZ85DRAFT_316507 [Elsinoe ampelina]|uniref:Secreted protein n=1 Tax=Elsinoe ampelina TaxID=302913 RepID=A0A6A6GNM5_9PEZI|nr:hypothetical protein BDZ85DRAFT_316507 [Elsinoe ampelina]
MLLDTQLAKICLAAFLIPWQSANAQVPPAAPESGVSAWPFGLSQVTLGTGRWLDNQDRTLTYLKWISLDRLVYNFRMNHKLSTNGAQPLGGWEAPDFPFRTHSQGHFLTAWAQCYAQLRDTVCRDRAVSFVQELAKAQDNNAAAGYNAGYLSGFPESEFDKLEARTLGNGNVPYYAVHKTMAGLLDVWRNIGDTTARDVLVKLSDWVNFRTSRLTYAQMQAQMATEFGGMNEVLADVYYQTGDRKYLVAAQRFDHAAVFDPLAANTDRLNGLHANTQVPKWIGAAREYKATGEQRYLDIARNGWRFTVEAHTYAIGGNSQAEHFRPPNAIAGYLTNDTAEACNTYNMLKLTRELFSIDPTSSSYFDFYENALINHLVGQQHKHSDHGHVTYFTPLIPGGRRGVGPAWGGGTWSTDYNSFWCCQGTGVETNTKLFDSIYYRDDSTLFVNLFAPSTLRWTQKDVTITQTTNYPAADTSSLRVDGSGTFAISVRIPAWTTGAEITVNGQPVEGLTIISGRYARIERDWATGDTVQIRIPLALRTIAANDDQGMAAVAYGPVILSGDYGNTRLTVVPDIELGSIKRSNGTLDFTATSAGQQVKLSPFYDASEVNYNVYWRTSGSLPT